MSNEVEELNDTLSEFQRRFAQLPDVEEPPQTLLHVLHKGGKETYWNTILSYFLDPSEPHGFGTDLLEVFLLLLKEKSEFEFDRLDFGELEVKSEWVMQSKSNIKPIPDITIYSGRNWFIIIEMKVHSPEANNQTWLYVCSDYIGTIEKSEFGETEEEKEQPEGEGNKQRLEDKRSHNYVYLAPETADKANAPQFANISWREVVEVLEQFKNQSHGRYPEKSHTQLSDFLDTIRRELNMTDEDFEQNQTEKMRLYLEYADEIDNVRESFDEWHEREAEAWKKRFLDDFRPPNWSDEWRADPSSFGQIYRKEWRQTKNRKPTEDKSEAIYRIDFVHKPKNKASFRNAKLNFRTYCPKRADDDFTAEFSRRFHDDDEAIDSTLQDHGITRKNGAKMWLTEKIYPFDKTRLPESYYEKLRIAFVEHQEIADAITRIFEATLNEVESE